VQNSPSITPGIAKNPRIAGNTVEALDFSFRFRTTNESESIPWAMPSKSPSCNGELPRLAACHAQIITTGTEAGGDMETD